MKPTSSSGPRVGTVALVVRPTDGSHVLLDAISDEEEIARLQSALEKGETEPLRAVYEYRQDRVKEEERFGDYVEELLSQPAASLQIQKQGADWFRSRARIDEYRRVEIEATRVIARYAYEVFLEDPRRREFVLAAEKGQVRIRIIHLPDSTSERGAA